LPETKRKKTRNALSASFADESFPDLKNAIESPVGGESKTKPEGGDRALEPPIHRKMGEDTALKIV
jgi:hypothetical protein